MGKGPEALGLLCLTQDGGRQPPQASHAGGPPACGWLCSPPFLWMCWEQLPLCPSDPICSATAQIQFRHRVPLASSRALSLRNHSNPPKQRTSNLNKPSDISLAGQGTEQDSPHACLFETLGLCWPLSNLPVQCTPLSPSGQTPHLLVDLATVLSQQDTSIFCDPKHSFYEVQLCPFTEINLHRTDLWIVDLIIRLARGRTMWLPLPGMHEEAYFLEILQLHNFVLPHFTF